MLKFKIIIKNELIRKFVSETLLRRPEPIYMHVSYVLESRFSAGMKKPISMTFGFLNKEWSNVKKMLFILL